MNGREYFIQWVESVGGRTEAARLVQRGYAAVDHVYQGRNEVSQDMAERVHAAGGPHPGKLLWGDSLSDSPLPGEAA